MDAELPFFQLQGYRVNPHQNVFGIGILKSSHPYFGFYRYRARMKWSCKQPKAGNCILKHFDKYDFLAYENYTQASLIKVITFRPASIYLCLLDLIRGKVVVT